MRAPSLANHGLNEEHGASRAGSWLEFAALFAVCPVILLLMKEKFPPLAGLWAVASSCFLSLRNDPAFHAARQPVEPFPRGIDLRLFGLSALLLIGGVLAFQPALFLILPRAEPGLWAAMFVLYPVLSVLPQEWIFRVFLFHRYGKLFRNETELVAGSAAAFAFAHIIYQNWVAIGLSLAGGLIFASTYARTRSLATVCLEHTLYGLLVFSVGLAPFFGLAVPAVPAPAPAARIEAWNPPATSAPRHEAEAREPSYLHPAGH